MLFGVLANRADWTLADVALISLLGFTGSGQFTVLPLSESGTGFLTMLLLAASINCRYLPIAYISSKRLPRPVARKALAAHMLGDEAYALEKDNDPPSVIFLIRLTIFIVWTLSAVLGASLASFIPDAMLVPEINLGFPASVVLMYLSISQIRARITEKARPALATFAAIGLCALIALGLIKLLGPLYFWIPSVLLAMLILLRARL